MKPSKYNYIVPFGEKYIFFNGITQAFFMVSCVRLCSWANYRLGNLTDHSIEELWNGERAEEFRKSMLDGSYRFCDKKKCPYLANDTLDSMMVEYALPKYPKQCSLSYERACNYVCKFCRTEKYIPDKDEKNNIKIIEKEIAKFIDHLDILSSNGVGEIFCSPSIMKTLSKIKHERDIKIELESNGSLFNESNWARISNLGDHNLSVEITVHSFNEKTYQFLSGTSLPIDNIIENLHFVSRLREKGVINFFEIATVVCERNFREMPDFVKKCLEFNPDSVRLRFFEPYGVGNKSDEWFYDIRNPFHPYYNEFVEIMKHPIFTHPKVWKWQGETLSDQQEHPYFEEKRKVKLLNKMITMKNLKEKIGFYQESQGVDTFALYGNGLVGQAFATLLEKNNVVFGAIFDTYAQGCNSYEGHEIVKPDRDNIKEYDFIVITSAAIENIKSTLDDLEYAGKIICLEDFIS